MTLPNGYYWALRDNSWWLVFHHNGKWLVKATSSEVPVGFFDYVPTLAERLIEPEIAAHCLREEAMG